MILGDVEETITTIEIDDETYEEIVKVRHACMARDCLNTYDALSTAPAQFVLFETCT